MDQAHLLIKTRRVVYNVQMLVPRPAIERLLVHLARLLVRLSAHCVVGQSVKRLGAVRGRYKVQDGVVPVVSHRHGREVELLEQQLPLRAADLTGFLSPNPSPDPNPNPETLHFPTSFPAIPYPPIPEPLLQLLPLISSPNA